MRKQQGKRAKRSREHLRRLHNGDECSSQTPSGRQAVQTPPTRLDNNKKVHKEVKKRLMWMVENGVPINTAMIGFGKNQYYKWRQEEQEERPKKKTGPKRKLSNLDAEKIGQEILNKKYANMTQAGLQYNVSRETIRRTITTRR